MSDPSPSYDALKPRQKRAVDLYVGEGTSTPLAQLEAYRTAGYKGQRQAAHRFFRGAKVAAAVAERQARISRRAEMSQDEIVGLLESWVRLEMQEIAAWEGFHVALKPSDELSPAASSAIEQISGGKHGPKVKLVPKMQALRTLLAMRGLLRPQVDLDLSSFDDDELEQLSAGRSMVEVLADRARRERSAP